MKLSDTSPYALRICAAIAILAGCGGSQVPIGPVQLGKNTATTTRVGPPGSRAISSVRSASELSGEALTSTEVTLKQKDCHCTFRATGRATGPYPGTFTAKGYYRFIIGDIGDLYEHLVIVSRATTVRVAVSGYGNVGRGSWFKSSALQYRSGRGSGYAGATIREHSFEEHLR